VNTLWPCCSSKFDTRRQHQPPCQAPCTSTKVLRCAVCAPGGKIIAIEHLRKIDRYGQVQGRKDPGGELEAEGWCVCCGFPSKRQERERWDFYCIEDGIFSI
jgi:hypothetical protein